MLLQDVEEDNEEVDGTDNDKDDIVTGHGNTHSTIHTDMELLQLSQQVHYVLIHSSC